MQETKFPLVYGVEAWVVNHMRDSSAKVTRAPIAVVRIRIGSTEPSSHRHTYLLNQAHTWVPLTLSDLEHIRDGLRECNDDTAVYTYEYGGYTWTDMELDDIDAIYAEVLHMSGTIDKVGT